MSHLLTLLTCFNARDAGGVEHPLHLSGTHWNCSQCPQLKRRKNEIIKACLVAFLVVLIRVEKNR